MMADLLPEHPDFLWRNPEPKSSYDAVIVGGGGHGLATAYFLAKNHGMTNIAVLEKGWLAGGNMARNTTIIRSNYLWDESAAIYEHALKLWEILPEELEYDFLFSQRGVMNLATPWAMCARACGEWVRTSSMAWMLNGWIRSRSRNCAPS
jgi:sarcosine oxidase subunit beta